MATKRKSLIGRESSSAGIRPAPVASKSRAKAPIIQSVKAELYEELSAGPGDSCPVILTDDHETGLVLVRIAGAVSRVVLIDTKKAVQAVWAVKEHYPENELIAAFRWSEKRHGKPFHADVDMLSAFPHDGESWAAVKDAQGLDGANVQFWNAVELARLLGRVNARISRGRVFQPLDAKTILNTQYGDPVWAIDQLIPAGVTLLASRPKKGKSWLALQMALAVAQGVPFMGMNTKRGAVFYAALEDVERRLKQRMQALGVDELSETERERLIFTTQFPALDMADGIPALAQIITETKPSLVIFDVWRRCQPEIREAGLNAQQKDYKSIFPLTCLAAETNTPILVLTHQNKQASKAGEMLDGVADSLGLSGAVDGIITLNRDGQSETAFLKREGREYEDTTDIHMTWQKGGGWRLASAQEVQDRANALESETKRKIRQVLENSIDESGRVIPMSFTEIVNVTGLSRGKVSGVLSRMKETETVFQNKEGKYFINPVLTRDDMLSKDSLKNNNNILSYSETTETGETPETPETCETIGEFRSETVSETTTETSETPVIASDDEKGVSVFREFRGNAQSTKNAGNNSQTLLAARLAPYFKGQNVEMVSKTLAAAIVESQQTAADVAGLSQFSQGELFPDENLPSARGYPSEASQ